MKVWVVEWRSAPCYDHWTDIKGVFSTREAAEAYAQKIAPKAEDLTAMLMEPSAFVDEFTLDEPDETE